jgi:hypothetical protein
MEQRKSDSQLENHFSPMTSTNSGIISLTKILSRNAPLSISDNLEDVLNLTKESDLHKKKHLSPKISIDAGITISTKPVFQNAHFSIRNNLELV